MEALKNTNDFGNVYCVYLLLGPQCNMQCRHCSQVPVKHMLLNETLSDDTKQFLDNFIKASVQCELGNKMPRLLMFWGGEALLHWKLIKEIVEEYTRKYDILQNKNFRFKITSNGLLLNQEIVDFCNAYEVHFAFSYDAPNSFAVRGKVPNSVLDLFNQIHNKIVIAGYNAYNTDIYTAFRCIEKRFPNAYYHAPFELMLNFPMAKDIYDFDFDEVRQNFKKLRIAMQLHKSKELSMKVFRKLSFLKHSNLNAFFQKFGVKQCLAGLYTLNVTLDGRIPTCHNSSQFVGTVNDSLQDIFNRSLELYIKGKNPACETCEHKDICTGGCHLSMRDTNGNFLYCELYRKKIFGIFKEEMLQLGEPLSENDYQWFLEEDKKTDEIVKRFIEHTTV